jgi:hypothetical protein
MVSALAASHRTWWRPRYLLLTVAESDRRHSRARIGPIGFLDFPENLLEQRLVRFGNPPALVATF